MAEKLTPLIAQYRRIKEQHKDALLLFRVGDFYEMFFEDAEVGAKVLGLVLTSRPHGPGSRVPLAGIPAKALDTYIGRLVAQGVKVAVCDQLEPPSSAKPVVRRDVIEVVTPGTITNPNLLKSDRNNFLLAISPAGDSYGLAFCDVSTGEFGAAEVPAAAIAEEVQKLDPSEVLVPQGWSAPPGLLRREPTRRDDYYFTQEYAFDKLSSHFGVANLDGFGVGALTEGVCAAGAVISYLEETQRTALAHIRKLTPYATTDYMLIDRLSRRNLELVERVQYEDQRTTSEGTLLSVLDRTRTPAGTRLLRRWVLAPLLAVAGIRARQDAVAELTETGSIIERIEGLLAEVGDLERIASRAALERANARDIVALRNWLRVAPEIKAALECCRSGRLCQVRDGIDDFSAIVHDISDTLVEDPPMATSEGGIINPGAHPELDELRSLASDAKGFIARLQESERARTGIPNLRIRFNSVFGYYIEVTKSYLNLTPQNYLRKQTVLNAERFITPELKDYESRVLHAEDRIREIETKLFGQLRLRVGAEARRVLVLSALLAELDALASLARVARDNGYVRPVVDDSTVLEIADGRHPVVAHLLAHEFISNSTRIDPNDQQVIILTGPNMAGKSTYLRQVALITIMAQVGSFVPASSARVGIVDKVFTRIGASDDLSRGVSTFLAEMTETANILNNATRRSLVILDEIGRGTATNDGLAIAWATVEFLHGLDGAAARPKTVFATHYHELTDIVKLLPRARNYSLSAKEQHGEVLFLWKLKEGPADRSYGIAVAKLAGLPTAVIERARRVLADFEKGEAISVSRLTPGTEQPPLAADAQGPHPALAGLVEADIDRLAPIDALNLLVRLKRMVRDEDPTA